VSLDLVFVALADPTRRAILRRLSHGEIRVTRIAQPFTISLNSVSKHIRILERARLVRRRRRGREHLVSLNLESFDEAAGWMKDQQILWRDRLDTLSAQEATEDREHTSVAVRHR
jgi:DNA-binding transcriptional ArsR family regulator